MAYEMLWESDSQDPLFIRCGHKKKKKVDKQKYKRITKEKKKSRRINRKR